MDSILHTAKLDLLISWPEAFTMWVLGFMLFQPAYPGLYKRIAILTITTSVYTDALLPFLPLPLRLVNALASSAVGLAIVFRGIPWKRLLALFLFCYTMAIFTETVYSGLFRYLLGTSFESFVTVRIDAKGLALFYGILALEWVAIWRLHRRGRLLGIRSLIESIAEQSAKGILPVVLLISLQFGLIGTIEILYFIRANGEHPVMIPSLVAAALALCVASLAFVLRLLVRAREETAQMAQNVYVEEIDRMFTSIRGQRHDFLNHVQVMHTMLQMGKTEQLKAYMADVVKETHEVNAIVRHGSPALAAFVQAKTAVADSRGIAFSCELSERWDPLSAIRIIDIVKIVGNLVNNAMDETERLDPEDRQVRVGMFCLPNQVELTVANRGRSLGESERELVFRTGYTTKADGHSGLGLTIVRERVKHYKGTIDVSSPASGWTEFRVVLPHRESAASAGHSPLTSATSASP